MIRGEINFDRFVRGALALAVLVVAFFLLSYLSPVLLPFFVAWVAAYMLYPIVRFLQYKCHLRNRILCIFLTLMLVGGVIAAVSYVMVPPFVEEMGHVKEVAARYIGKTARYQDSLPQSVETFIRKNISPEQIEKLLKEKNVQAAIQNIVPKAWNFIWSTAGWVINMIASLIGLLYFFFLLKDYELYSEGWLRYVPQRRRSIVSQIVGDIETGMNGYFRGQALVALSNCVMFSLGFWIIGFPLPIALGCFIGLISFVPYLQVVGILPAIILALLRAADTGQNFWLLIGGVLLVYIVVQILQDSIVTPYVMGNITGLSPAVILLSLSVWGYMLGIIGLIIALPVTTLMISYYRRYVVGEVETAPATVKAADKKPQHRRRRRKVAPENAPAKKTNEKK
ncbi:MAG: AI-2E family transporter [Alloprevotella sp.]|nr:AI-2E family transporter [Alloprevotella sp.]